MLIKKPQIICLLLLLWVGPAFGAPATTQLNPMVSYTNVLFQWDYFNKLGPTDHYLALNIQPSVPFHLNDKLDLVSLSDIPINSEMKMIYPNSQPMALGDIQEDILFSQTNTGNIYAGFGPVFLFPTASTPRYGSEKWGIGPAMQLAVFEANRNYGLLANHIWSFAGNPNRNDISQTFLNPWLTYTIDPTTNAGIQTESYYNWLTNKWQIPLEGYYNKFLSINNQLVKLGFFVLYWPVAPDYYPNWSLRFNLTLIFPKS